MIRGLLLILLLCLAPVLQAGVTTHLKADCRVGTRTCSAEGEVLRYDASWYANGDEARISDNGVVVATGVAGIHTWHPEPCCSTHHTLKLEVLSAGQVVGTETAAFETATPTAEHAVVISRPFVAPTENASGWTEEWACSQCGEVFIERIEIPSFSTVLTVAESAEINYYLMGARQVEIAIDGVTTLVATNSGTFVWQPVSTGAHTLQHIAGTNVWSWTVNVTAVVHEVPAPNPPCAPDANMSLATTSRALTSTAAANGAIVTKGSGTWTATASADWISITIASRNAGLPVAYTVAANAGVAARTGYIYVNGHVFTITQPGVGATLASESAAFEAEGGAGTVTVQAGASATWHAWSNVDWISVETTVGQGEEVVTFAVAPYHVVTTRSGTITVAGRTFTVNQTGRRMALNVTEIAQDYRAHDLMLTVDALPSTTWGMALEAPWLSVVDGGTGRGGSAVTLAINENPSYAARTATARIGTETLTVRQAGRPASALAFALSPETTTASVKGANGLAAVTATPDLPWTATSQANWLTVMPGFAAGAGNGNVIYTASPNPTLSARSGAIRVAPDAATALAAKTHTVNQPAAVATMTPDAHVFAAAGDSFEVAVSVDDIVGWTVAKNASWVSILGGLSRTGPGTVTVSVAQNLTIDARETTVTIAGHVFTVRQRGQELTLDYEPKVFAPESYEEACIEVRPDGNVNWTAVPSDPSWIVIWSNDANCTMDAAGNVNGTGSATIGYMLLPYAGDGEAKTGWIQIGDKKVYVTQRAYDLAIDPCAADVAGNAGAGEVAVPATAGQIWEAIATEPWITVIAGAEGMGPGTVRYTFTDNDTGAVRTGKIIIAGEEYEVRQAARLRATVSARVEGQGEVTGAGVYDKGAPVTLAAIPADGWRLAGWRDGTGGTIGTEATLAWAADGDVAVVAVFEAIPLYAVNGEIVRAGETRTFTAPSPVVLGGATQLVCRGSSSFPEKGTSFTLVITGDLAFAWDLWATNYWVDVSQSAGGAVTAHDGARALPGWVAAGSAVSLTATPAADYALMRWRGDGAQIGSALSHETVVAHGPLSVGAVFGVFDDTLATAADAPSLAFRTGGDAAWAPVIDPRAETGCTSVRSGAIGPECETWLETTVPCAGTLAFRWRVDCEHDDSGAAAWNRLTVFTNGVEAARLDGQTDWQRVTLPLPTPHTAVRWSFYRDDHDEQNTTNENAAWIDSVEVHE